MSTPPIVSNTDFQQWQSWQQVKTPSGDRTYYVIPGYNGQYVFDPYTSDATGRITIYQNPAPLYEAERKAREQQEAAGSSSSQLAGIAGTVSGALATKGIYDIATGADKIAGIVSNPWAGASTGTGASTGAGVGAGAGAGGAAPEILSAKYVTSTGAGVGTGAGAGTGAGVGTGAGASSLANTPLIDPTLAAAAFAVAATLMNKHGEKYIGDPVISGLNKLTGNKRAQDVTDESFVTAKRNFAKQLPWFDQLSPEQQDEMVLVARRALMTRGGKAEDPNTDFAALQKEMQARAEEDPKFAQATQSAFGRLANEGRGLLNPGPSFAVNPTWGVTQGAYKGLGERTDPRTTSRSHYMGEELLKYGVTPQYIPEGGDFRGGKPGELDFYLMWQNLPLEKQLEINKAQGMAGSPVNRLHEQSGNQWEGLLNQYKAIAAQAPLKEVAPESMRQDVPIWEGPSASTQTRKFNNKTWNLDVDNLSKDDMATMLAQLMDGKYPKGQGSPVQIVPARSGTLSPGINLQGQRIKY